MKELVELMQLVGIPAVVIAAYLFKEYRQGNKDIELLNKILAINENQLKTQQETNKLLTENAKDVLAIKLRLEMAQER